MKNLISILLLNLLILYMGFAQLGVRSLDASMEPLQNKNVFFNRKLINPTNLTDSNNIIIDFAIDKQWIGGNIAKNGFFISGETGFPSNKFSIGVNIDSTI